MTQDMRHTLTWQASVREVPKASTISVSDRALEDAGALEMAVRHAFWEACELLRRDGALMPFTVVCTSSGMEMADHPAASSDEVYEGVKTLLARVAPEAYVLCYDGSIDVDGRHTDAVVCEAARRGDSEASLLALPYTIGENGYVFDDAYACVGVTSQLQRRAMSPNARLGAFSGTLLFV